MKTVVFVALFLMTFINLTAQTNYDSVSKHYVYVHPNNVYTGYDPYLSRTLIWPYFYYRPYTFVFRQHRTEARRRNQYSKCRNHKQIFGNKRANTF